MKQFFLVTLLFSVGAVSAQNLSRKVVLAKGQQFEQINKVNMNMTQEMMGQSIEIKMESTSNNLMEVKDAGKNSYLIANTLKRLVMSTSGVQETNFDSDKKEDMDSEIGKSIKGKIGKVKEFSINQDGMITKVNTKEAPEENNAMAAGMSKMFGQDAEEKEGTAFQALANIPGNGVKVGDSWTDSTKEGNSKTFTTYTLKKVEGNDATVSLTGNMNINRDIEQQGMTIQLALQGTTLGEYIFDVATGIVKARKATTKASGTVEAMGQSIPMTIDSTISSAITKK